ncbi:uncharacterized protein FMAN_14171 [Fusarium mangiferae]|uniref:Uncharacterized protein n=1 Tax=Fusarium mangiferae TaxID=192010 RepID=A0A1L7UCP5_FUSMA|nr:uncharacterized protein FMAN_14171 [Fusarium mangiferae]CVL08179.1 uncharacterized protein FMAN_14171 [Fusarium mangiferae]
MEPQRAPAPVSPTGDSGRIHSEQTATFTIANENTLKRPPPKASATSPRKCLPGRPQQHQDGRLTIDEISTCCDRIGLRT